MEALLAKDVLERLIPIQVRMLDNVIDLNALPVPQATITNRKYRAIGLGTFGWHHLLAQQAIQWESPDAEALADRLYERINFLTIQASAQLAKEKGSYPMFAGSDWHNGRYFRDRDYSGAAWDSLAREVATHGLRNGWLLAVAPGPTVILVASVYEAAAARLEATVAEISATKHRPIRQRRIGHADLPLAVALDEPHRVGIDRLAAAAAASLVKPAGRPAVVVDCGTAVTVDMLAADGRFLGGAILPGPSLMARALADGTSKEAARAIQIGG